MDISISEIENLSTKLNRSVATGNKDALSMADMMQVSAVFDCWKQIAHRLHDGKMSMTVLRNIFGLVKFADDLANADAMACDDQDNGADQDEELRPKPEFHGKRGEDKFPNADIVCHHHRILKEGQICPECGEGKLYKHTQENGKIRTLIRITGHAPLQATIHKFFDLRCNDCKTVFKVETPEDLAKEGSESQRFSNSAIAMIGVQKYLSGTPWFRQSELQKYLGVEINSTSMWDQCEILANALKPIFSAIFSLAAQEKLFYTDDTGATIINKKSAKMVRRGTDKIYERDGCHSSCLVSLTGDNRQIVMIKTDIIHAGEWFDEILKFRQEGLPPPLHMADRAACNSATVVPTIELGCNQHARQRFIEIEEKFKYSCGKILKLFSKVFKNDQNTIAMSAMERLHHHQEQSLPLMRAIFDQAQSELNTHAVEPNSPLGKAYNYLLNHQEALLGFTKYEEAPLSNNLCERMIKKIVLLRKNSWFYRSVLGARVSDIILSLGLTAVLCNANPFEYFKAVLHHREQAKLTPHSFMPWNFTAIT